MEYSFTGKNKTPRVRSVAYPSYVIASSFTLASKIAKEFTDIVFTSREDISKHIKLSGGALLMQLSSCVQYGLLTMKSKEGYKPTELYRKISRPLPDENVNDLLKECFQNPELYKKLIIDFKDKQLPTPSGLANILDRKYNVKGNASTVAAKIFFNNLEALGMISDNTFSFDAEIQVGEEVEDNTEEQLGNAIIDEYANQDKPKESPQIYLLNPPKDDRRQDVFDDYIEIPVPLKDGRKAKILMPEGYTDEDVVKVHKVLTGYLP